jgi:hypothetical protein
MLIWNCNISDNAPKARKKLEPGQGYVDVEPRRIPHVAGFIQRRRDLHDRVR